MNITIRILQLKGRAHELIRRFPIAVFWQAVLFLVGAGIILLRPDLYAEGSINGLTRGKGRVFF